MKRSTRAVAHAMEHDRALLRAIRIGVFQIEVLRHLEVELHGAALPGAAKRVGQMEVDLRAVEGAVAFVDLVFHTELLERGLEAAPRLLPNPRPSPCESSRAGGQLDVVGEPKLLVHRVDQAQRRPRSPQSSWSGRTNRCASSWLKQRTRNRPCSAPLHLVAVHQADLARANGQVAIAMRLGCVHEHAARAVHRLDRSTLLRR